MGLSFVSRNNWIVLKELERERRQDYFLYACVLTCKRKKIILILFRISGKNDAI